MVHRYLCFNPRTREGCDFDEIADGSLFGVSIHAPARGATYNLGRSPRQTLVSIHAPARGATLQECLHHEVERVSIHAPARGATQKKVKKVLHIWKFQSTHPRGVRLSASVAKQLGRVSIHAPARGATAYSKVH